MEHWKKINIKFDSADDESSIWSLGVMALSQGFEGENFVISSVACPDCRCAMSATLFPNGYWISTDNGEKAQLKGVNSCLRCHTIYGAGKSQDGKWGFFKLKPRYADFVNKYMPEMNRIGCVMDEKNFAASFFKYIQQNL